MDVIPCGSVPARYGVAIPNDEIQPPEKEPEELDELEEEDDDDELDDDELDDDELGEAPQALVFNKIETLSLPQLATARSDFESPLKSYDVIKRGEVPTE